MGNIINLDRADKLSRIINHLDSASKQNRKYASFHKIANHVHTPQSHDYHLFEIKKDLTFNQLVDLAIKNNIFPKCDFPLENFNDETFNSPEEEFEFLIQAKKISDERIEAVVVTDHNRIDGISKLKKAVTILKKYNIIGVGFSVISGIEVSCADKTHVVGMFEDKFLSDGALDNWINDYIMDEISGTYKTAIDVLKDIDNMGGIGYIAHINSNNLLFGEHSLSGGYKKELFNLPFMRLFGLKDPNQADIIQNKMKQFRIRKDKLYPILEEDSHCLKEIGNRTFWVKSERLNFKAIKDALIDFDLCTYSGLAPQAPGYYIKAIYVGGESFLSSNSNKDDLCFSLSERMNAFIGGRGTGKSTILELLDLLLTQQINDDEKKFKYLLSQGDIAALVQLEGKSYYILFNGSHKTPEDIENNDKLIDEYNSYFKNYNRKLWDESTLRKARKSLTRKRIQIFHRIDGNQIEEITTKQNILDKIYTRQFSVNHIVDIASGNKLSPYIYDLLSENPSFKTNKQRLVLRSVSSARKYYKSISRITEERKKEVLSLIDEFNNVKKSQLMLRYEIKSIKDIDFHWERFLNLYSEDDGKIWFKKYNISCGNLLNYLSELSELINPFEVFFLLLDKNYSSLIHTLNYTPYLETNIKKITDEALERIPDGKNTIGFFNSVRRQLLIHNNILCQNMEKYLSDFDIFHLYFNVNHKATHRTMADKFIEVPDLSMGQKVVSMMSFILAFDDFTNVINPLVIDQPEDNLDNQYIYYNLVHDLRKIKGKRQVIIASHNSTVVVNSGTEQVIVMESDGQHGWIDHTGYSMKESTIKRIVDIMEGGEKAFIKKERIYNLNQSNANN